VWKPIALASEIATLDVLSAGRAVLGVGAGHTPAEWTMRGLPYPSPAERVEHMVELIDTTRRLLLGEEVTFSGAHIALQRAAEGGPVGGVGEHVGDGEVVDVPRPIQPNRSGCPWPGGSWVVVTGRVR
jgi:alkanesulfonate monooxygenase SsuD/methylene tetrahydromethanopterin reductase-like flavin-dependent oxidoreductase (luciferase family)